MTNCISCKYRGGRCYCPPDKECTAYEKNFKLIKHTFEFYTPEDWKPNEVACWTDCPFSFNINYFDTCKCHKDKSKLCPFVNGIVKSEVVDD